MSFETDREQAALVEDLSRADDEIRRLAVERLLSPPASDPILLNRDVMEQLRAVESESQQFAERCVEIEEENSNLANLCSTSESYWSGRSRSTSSCGRRMASPNSITSFSRYRPATPQPRSSCRDSMRSHSGS